MTNEKAKKMLEAKLKCFIAETSGTNHDCNMRLCDGCALNYEQGNMGEQKQALDIAIQALERASCIKEKCAYCPHCEHCDVDDETLEIKALEQQPSEDCISRDEAIRIAEQGQIQGYEWQFKKLCDLSSVTPTISKMEQVEDCIGRKAVEEITWEEPSYSDALNAITEIRDKIRQLPSVTPQQTEWIPVSERLPEDIKPVIVTWKNTDPKSYYQYIIGKHFIGTAHYKSGKWYWYSSVTEDLLAEYGKCDGEEFDEAIEVIAWMPLPQPYVESEDEE